MVLVPIETPVEIPSEGLRQDRSAVSTATQRRVAVIGCGVCSPAAHSAKELVNLLTAREPQRARPVKQLLAREELDNASGLGVRESKKVDRFSLLALAAARRALRDAGLKSDAVRHCGIVSGNMMAGWTFTEPQLRALHALGLGAVSPYLATAWFPAAPQGQVTIHLNMQGFAKTVTTDQSAGAQAIGMAFERIRDHRADLLLAGGVEAPVTPFVQAALTQLGEGPGDLAEAAAFILLSTADGGCPAIGAHTTFPLPCSESFPAEVIVRQIAAFLHELPDRPPVQTAVCNVAADLRIEEEIASIVRKAVHGAEPRLFFPMRAIGNCLGASSAIAAVVAYEVLSQATAPCSALVLSVGHQCGDLLWMYRWS